MAGSGGSARTYAEKLRDPRWQRRRLEILSKANFTCRDCKSKENTLHVHHAYYERGADPWDYPDRALLVLCEDCHELRQQIQNEVLAELASLDIADLDRVYGMAAALADWAEGRPGLRAAGAKSTSPATDEGYRSAEFFVRDH